MPILFSRSTDQRHGRYKDMKNFGTSSSYISKYNSVEVETLHVGRVWVYADVRCLCSKNLQLLSSTELDNFPLYTALWAIVAATNKRSIEGAT